MGKLIKFDYFTECLKKGTDYKDPFDNNFNFVIIAVKGNEFITTINNKTDAQVVVWNEREQVLSFKSVYKSGKGYFINVKGLSEFSYYKSTRRIYLGDKEREK